jgi:hypothetical protein
MRDIFVWIDEELSTFKKSIELRFLYIILYTFIGDNNDNTLRLKQYVTQEEYKT